MYSETAATLKNAVIQSRVPQISSAAANESWEATQPASF
jgi:hypothetical protein